jgi:glucuronate isomerase
MFSNASSAIDFENETLQAGAEFLPPIAQKVLRGEELSSAEEAPYYAFLLASLAEARQ